MRFCSMLAGLAFAIAALAGPAEAERAGGTAPAEAHGAFALALAADGTLTATGELPAGLAPEAIVAALPGVDLSGVERSGAGAAAEWQPVLDALSIVLPRFRTASVRTTPGELAIRGELKRGLSTAGVSAALRAALGIGWRLQLDLVETAPAAEIVLTKSGEGITVRGLLPAGLAPPEAVEQLGPGTSGAGLAGGGDGHAGEWSRVLAALSESLDLFASATARVSTGRVDIDGVLLPGYPPQEVAERLSRQLPTDWLAALTADETPASEGDRRVSLDTGQPESFRRGYWLPDVGFPVSVERCRAEADAALAAGGVDGGLPFVAGTEDIDERGLPLLNRLAAIAVRCLNSSSLRLEIGGHTDSVGNDAKNEALSRARAETVRQALVDRGVRADAVAASGYGESRPVASNNTPDGRALNRRISFDWSDPES